MTTDKIEGMKVCKCKTEKYKLNDMKFVREALCKVYKSLIEIFIIVEVINEQIYLNYYCSAPELWTTWKKLKCKLGR